jgi:hypothetical protein
MQLDKTDALSGRKSSKACYNYTRNFEPFRSVCHLWYYVVWHQFMNWGSSVSVVCDYTLDDRTTEVRSPAEAKDFSCSICVERPSQPPIQWTPGVLSPGGKARSGSDSDHSPHLVPRSRMSRSYTSSPHFHLHGASGTALLLWHQLYFDSYFHKALEYQFYSNTRMINWPIGMEIPK